MRLILQENRRKQRQNRLGKQQKTEAKSQKTGDIDQEDRRKQEAKSIRKIVENRGDINS